MDLGANETENRITLLLDYTKDHLYEIDNRLKMAYYKPVFYDAQYDQLIILSMINTQLNESSLLAVIPLTITC